MRAWLAAGLALLVAGCAVGPPPALQIPPAPPGWLSEVVPGQDFRHRIYRREHRGASCLRVFIEGDGTPWARPDQVAADPTPRNPVMLRIASLTHGNVLYLGRPCYFGLAGDPGCGAEDWTFGRYSPEVVASMVAVVNRQAARTGADRVALVGHSGGGTLAALMAPGVGLPVSLLTIAAPLDTDAWARRHGYTLLFLSLNPARVAPLDRDVPQLHLLGGADDNVPVDIQAAYRARQPWAEYRELPQLSHDLSDRPEASWARLLDRELDAAGCLAD